MTQRVFQALADKPLLGKLSFEIWLITCVGHVTTIVAQRGSAVQNLG